MDINAIIWNVSPDIFSLGPVTLRWYGLLFVMGFIVGQFIMQRIFRLENKPSTDLDAIMLYMIVSTIVGARLGHCLFYQPEIYLANPIEILKIWEGGLASHGATLGILIGIYIYSRKRPDQPYLWVLDRIVIVVALGGCFIRLGNLMNSEIVGIPTDLPWGFIFVKNGENFARHPAQLYEAISCFFLFLLLYYLYNKMREKTPRGRLFSLFVIILFSLRFGYEFIKEAQVEFEQGMTFNMGQWLSIPMVIGGIYVYFQTYKNEKQENLMS